MNIVDAYGHKGPDSGDKLVADLLQRTVTGQWKVMQSLNELLQQPEARGLSLTMDLPLMNVLYAQKFALLRWLMASAFLDGIVEMHEKASDTLPADVYSIGDKLCDTARFFSKQAVEKTELLRAELNPGFMQAEALDLPRPTTGQYRAIWAVFRSLVLFVESDYLISGLLAVPPRFKALVAGDIQSARSHVRAFHEQEDEWRASKIPENRVELALEAEVHVKELYRLVQRLWAPYLYGAPYTVARNQPQTLSELSIQDPWVLTDPRKRQEKEKDPQNLKQLEAFWGSIRDVPATLQLAQQVEAFVANGTLRVRVTQGHGIVPWPSKYLVHRAFNHAGQSFATGELVMLYAGQTDSKGFEVTLRRVGKLSHPLDLLGAR